MLLIQEFCDKWNYDLSNELVYNSYRSWKRNYTRDYDSVSVTEILWLIEDSNIRMVKEFYEDKLIEAQKYGTKKHLDLENYSKDWILNNKDKIDINFKIFLIQKKITIKESEKTFKRNYKSLPIITGDIDNISLMNNEEIILDYKISKWERNFKSKKYNLQKAGYRWLSWIKQSWLLFLNQKKYELVISEDMEYYDTLWLDLLEYANYLFENNKIKNLANGSD